MTQIGHYASGSRVPSASNLRKLACALDISADYLLGIDTASVRIYQAPPRILTLIEQATRLRSAQMDVLLGIVQVLVEQKED